MNILPSIDCCMKREVIFVRADTTIRQAVRLMVDKKVGTLPIVDEQGALIGVTTISDIIQIFLPDFVYLLSDIDFVKDFGTLKSPSKERMDQVENLMVTDIMAKPITVNDDSSLIRALAIMHKHNLGDLPVLKDGKLVGISSRVDIGRAFFADWGSAPKSD